MVVVDQAKGLRRSNTRLRNAQEKATEEKRLTLQLKLKSAGLTGQKLGKYKVPESQVEVQLGEDLSESLRGLKVCFSIPAFNAVCQDLTCFDLAGRELV